MGSSKQVGSRKKEDVPFVFLDDLIERLVEERGLNERQINSLFGENGLTIIEGGIPLVPLDEAQVLDLYAAEKDPMRDDPEFNPDSRMLERECSAASYYYLDSAEKLRWIPEEGAQEINFDEGAYVSVEVLADMASVSPATMSRYVRNFERKTVNSRIKMVGNKKFVFLKSENLGSVGIELKRREVKEESNEEVIQEHFFNAAFVGIERGRYGRIGGELKETEGESESSKVIELDDVLDYEGRRSIGEGVGGIDVAGERDSFKIEKSEIEKMVEGALAQPDSAEEELDELSQLFGIDFDERGKRTKSSDSNSEVERTLVRSAPIKKNYYQMDADWRRPSISDGDLKQGVYVCKDVLMDLAFGKKRITLSDAAARYADLFGVKTVNEEGIVYYEIYKTEVLRFKQFINRLYRHNATLPTEQVKADERPHLVRGWVLARGFSEKDYTALIANPLFTAREYGSGELYALVNTYLDMQQKKWKIEGKLFDDGSELGEEISAQKNNGRAVEIVPEVAGREGEQNGEEMKKDIFAIGGSKNRLERRVVLKKENLTREDLTGGKGELNGIYYFNAKKERVEGAVSEEGLEEGIYIRAGLIGSLKIASGKNVSREVKQYALLFNLPSMTERRANYYFINNSTLDHMAAFVQGIRSYRPKNASEEIDRADAVRLLSEEIKCRELVSASAEDIIEKLDNVFRGEYDSNEFLAVVKGYLDVEYGSLDVKKKRRAPVKGWGADVIAKRLTALEPQVTARLTPVNGKYVMLQNVANVLREIVSPELTVESLRERLGYLDIERSMVNIEGMMVACIAKTDVFALVKIYMKEKSA
ncbi:MAG: hypothetical protein WC595_04550 [Candidatus Nanoarchaeia archaeon]